jgi:hypothetical protein
VLFALINQVAHRHAMQPLHTFDDVVTALGGPAAVGRLTSNPTCAVCNWRKKRDRFPAKYFDAMRTALAERGFVAPATLWGQVARFGA